MLMFLKLLKQLDKMAACADFPSLPLHIVITSDQAYENGHTVQNNNLEAIKTIKHTLW